MEPARNDRLFFKLCRLEKEIGSSSQALGNVRFPNAASGGKLGVEIKSSAFLYNVLGDEVLVNYS
jgi:hypothetical protein